MRDDIAVRTTLDLDADILQAAKELANLRGSTAGRMLSELARRGLQHRSEVSTGVRNGVPVIPRRAPGTPNITQARVNALRDEGD